MDFDFFYFIFLLRYSIGLYEVVLVLGEIMWDLEGLSQCKGYIIGVLSDVSDDVYMSC